MILRFVVPPELQQFLSGMPSRAVSNVLWNIEFNDPDTVPIIPTNPGTVRRTLVFDKAGYSAAATPNPNEYNCYIQNLDGSYSAQITFPRSI